MPQPPKSLAVQRRWPPPRAGQGFRNIPDPCFSTVYSCLFFLFFHCCGCRIPDPAISFSISPPATPPRTGARTAARRGKNPPRWFFCKSWCRKGKLTTLPWHAFLYLSMCVGDTNSFPFKDAPFLTLMLHPFEFLSAFWIFDSWPGWTAKECGISITPTKMIMLMVPKKQELSVE